VKVMIAISAMMMAMKSRPLPMDQILPTQSANQSRRKALLLLIASVDLSINASNGSVSAQCV
jgi:hypothetical protein